MSEHRDAEGATVAALRAAAPPVPAGPGPDLADVLRGGAARRARRARGRALVAASGTTAVLVAAVAVGASTLGGGGTPQAVPFAAAPPVVVEQLRLLGEPAGDRDVLPSVTLVQDQAAGLLPGSARLVADVDGVQVFAARDADEKVCVLVHQRGSSSSTSCLPPAGFAVDGLPFGFEDGGSRVRGVLVPDSWFADEADERVQAVTSPGSGLRPQDRVAPNLLLRVTDPAGASEGAGVRAEDELALLARPAGADDRLPTRWSTGEEVSDLGVVASSSRLVARTDAAAYYAATDDEARVCVLVHPRQTDAIGSSCATVAQFADAGVWTALGGPAGEEDLALLLPDGLADLPLESLPPGVLRTGEEELGADDVLAPNLLGRSTDR